MSNTKPSPCLAESAQQQIGLVPENDLELFDNIILKVKKYEPKPICAALLGKMMGEVLVKDIPWHL